MSYLLISAEMKGISTQVFHKKCRRGKSFSVIRDVISTINNYSDSESDDDGWLWKKPPRIISDIVIPPSDPPTSDSECNEDSTHHSGCVCKYSLALLFVFLQCIH